MRFKDRADAGERLAEALERYKNQKPLVVYALPRGGVVLGAVIAKRLDAPLSLVIPRKIGHPSHAEYAIAAVTENGTLVANPAEAMSLDEDWLQMAVDREKREARRRRITYLQGAPTISPENKTAIVVDDGAATGLTMTAALYEIRQGHPSRLIAALPVLPRGVLEALTGEADEIVTLMVPQSFASAVSSYYERFEQVEDEEVITLLKEVNHTGDQPRT